ncbi:MAG: sugar phosphate nucleotidyltransferase [Acidimicrobiia bacterium]
MNDPTDRRAKNKSALVNAGFTVAPQDTLRSANERIAQNGRDLVVVIGRDQEILGTLTDGAIRRAVLAGTGLDATVDQVMAAQPLTVSHRTAKKEVLTLLQAHRVRSVPVATSGSLVGIRSLDELGLRVAGAPIAVVMVGGAGERLRPLTDKVPKPLLKIGGSSIVERLIEGIARAGVREVYLTLNYKADMFEERLGTGEQLGVALHYVRERTAMGTAGALSLLPRVEGPILVVNGDLVTTADFRSLLDFHWHHEGSITVAGVEHLSPIPYGILSVVQHHVLAIEEKPHRRDLVAAGIYVLDPAVIRFVPVGVASGMPELIGRAVTEGLPVHVFPLLEEWFDIGSPEDFERVLMHFAVADGEI